jgi:pimeloyl-ACP methyl ester carboxylesterase
LPKAQLVCLPKAGHMLPYEEPNALAREVVNFLG